MGIVQCAYLNGAQQWRAAGAGVFSNKFIRKMEYRLARLNIRSLNLAPHSCILSDSSGTHITHISKLTGSVIRTKAIKSFPVEEQKVSVSALQLAVFRSYRCSFS